MNFVLFQALFQELHWFEDEFLVLTPLKPHRNHKRTMTLWAPAAYISRVYKFYFDLYLYLVVYAIVLCRKLLLRWCSINYIYIWVLVRVIKRNMFTNWLARKVPWTCYFWKHVFHIKIYQPGKYLGVPEVVIYVYSLDCYWCIRWWDRWRWRNSKWCTPNNKITPRPTGNMKLTPYLVILIVTLL